MMTDTISVSVEGAVKSFGGTPAVDGVSLKICKGEFLTLLGPSGCGKTTLLNLIAGFLEPERGEILIDGEVVTHVPPYRRSIGMVFQNYALFPHMTVAENVAFGLKMHKVPAREIGPRVAEALEMVRLPQMGPRTPRQLSGGQQQRVALARALVIKPSVILLDEPFSAIDKNLRADMQVELKRIQKRIGITTLFVTHDQSEALSLSDRIAVMSHGKIEQLSEPAELYRNPASSFVASFIGDINRMPCTVIGIEAGEVVLKANEHVLRLPKEHGAVDVLAAGSAALLFARPEELALVPAQSVEANLGAGVVDTHVYQGTHVDVYVRFGDGRAVRVRHPGFEALERFPAGSAVGVHANLAQAFVFPEK
ncbi:MAG: ABC transporter ATP-binding protein [Proteobacteria bacterium]|nr:ABC transporter ATP-binding protein [Pseudomonadota bacterium]